MCMPHELSTMHLRRVEQAAAEPVQWQNWVKGRLKHGLGLHYDFLVQQMHNNWMLVWICFFRFVCSDWCICQIHLLKCVVPYLFLQIHFFRFVCSTWFVHICQIRQIHFFSSLLYSARVEQLCPYGHVWFLTFACSLPLLALLSLRVLLLHIFWSLASLTLVCAGWFSNHARITHVCLWDLDRALIVEYICYVLYQACLVNCWDMQHAALSTAWSTFLYCVGDIYSGNHNIGCTRQRYCLKTLKNN